MPVAPPNAPRKSPFKNPPPLHPPQKTVVRKASEATILAALNVHNNKKPSVPEAKKSLFPDIKKVLESNKFPVPEAKKPSVPGPHKPPIPSSTTTSAISSIASSATSSRTPKPLYRPKPKQFSLIHDQYPVGQTRQSAFEHHLHKEPIPIQAKNWSCVSILLFTTLTVFYTLLSVSAKSAGAPKETEHIHDNGNNSNNTVIRIAEESTLSLRCVGGDTEDAWSILALFMNPLGCIIHLFGCLLFQKAVDLGHHRDPDYRIKHIRWYIYSMLGPIGSIVLVFSIKVGKCWSSGLFWIFTLFELAGMSGLLYWGWRMAKLYMMWLKNPDYRDLEISDEEDTSRSPSQSSAISGTSGKSTATQTSTNTVDFDRFKKPSYNPRVGKR